MDVFNVSSDSLFISATARQAQMETVAQRVLGNALESFVAKRYDEAISGFKRAIGLAPITDTAVNAYDYMAKAYVSKGDAKSAIAAYEESLRVNPTRADTFVSIGNIHVTLEQMDQAQVAYEKAVTLDPSAANRYSLGQAYLENGRYDDAERQFMRVREQEPNKPNGEYGLGLTYAKQGRSQDAINAFDRAIAIQQDFWFAHVEKGYVLADIGERDQAAEIVNTLEDKAAELSETLSNYIYEKTPPEMLAAYSTSTFAMSLGPRTQVANLGSYLVDPSGQQTFTMEFQFSKDMDPDSVENITNWRITRSVYTGRADGYNFNMPIPTTEVSLSPLPLSVSYDETYKIATVMFRIRQNDTADGTIDPSHIKFTFSGTDVLGLAMNPKADEYTGFSGFA